MLDATRIKTYAQESSSTCGPAALRILLAYFGIEMGEKVLARLCKTTKKGTKPEMLEYALQKLGFKTKSGNGGKAKDAWKILDYWVNKRNLPVLVDWFSPLGNAWSGHYAVVVALTKDKIMLADPEFGEEKERIYEIAWPNFLIVWFDWKGDYVEDPKDIILRGWLVGWKD